MSKNFKDWLYIAKRLVQVGWAAVIGFVRTAGPSFTLCAAITAAYAMGDVGVNPWWMVACMVVGGFAITLAEDRAEAKASTKFANQILGMIENDHTLEITVTNKTEVVS